MICATCHELHPPTESCPTLIRPYLLPTEGPAELADGVPVGSVFGAFQVLRPLGRGGMGSVYLAAHVERGTKVALKFLHSHLCTQPSLVRRFKTEARALSRIDHPNILSVYDFQALPSGAQYMVTEFLEGESLSSRVGKPMPVKEAIPILVQVCDALEAAHQAQVVHRDLKPENIFLLPRAEGGFQVKLLDFGVAKLLEGNTADHPTQVGTILGTPEFMAPEQAFGGRVDGRADLYSLGVIAFLLATGRLPFTGHGVPVLLMAHRTQAPPSPRQVEPSVDSVFSEVILTALAKRPEERFPSAAQMKKGLLRALAHARRAPEQTIRAKLEGDCRWHPAREFTRAGVFVVSEGPFPPLRTQLRVTLQAEAGVALTVGAEVVRHVDVAQAAAWRMPAGYGLQFLESPSAPGGRWRSAVTPPATPVRDDPVALHALLHYRMVSDDDGYRLLGVAWGASAEEIRAAGRRHRRELESLRSRPVSVGQEEAISRALSRVERAAHVLGRPASRAAYDAQRGNYQGVLRSLAAGLTATELEELRHKRLQLNPTIQGKWVVQAAMVRALIQQRRWSEALKQVEQALVIDPLCLEMLRQYCALSRQLSTGASSAGFDFEAARR